jgi:hypothetical protein
MQEAILFEEQKIFLLLFGRKSEWMPKELQS